VLSTDPAHAETQLTVGGYMKGGKEKKDKKYRSPYSGYSGSGCRSLTALTGRRPSVIPPGAWTAQPAWAPPRLDFGLVCSITSLAANESVLRVPVRLVDRNTTLGAKTPQDVLPGAVCGPKGAGRQLLAPEDGLCGRLADRYTY
jgi:hypothetical protein